MKVIIQRVSKSIVYVDNKIVGKINAGLNILVGFTVDDNEIIVDKLIDKILKLRIFDDNNNKINLSLKDVGGEILLISQFTLYADTRNGNRPSFTQAAKPEVAKKLYDYMLFKLSSSVKTNSGVFGANMIVEIINDGPLTIIIDSDEK
jgi:D-tyrosyl-tRNA(Tyr) deacylase